MSSSSKSQWAASTPFKMSVIFSLTVLTAIAFIRRFSTSSEVIPVEFIPWIPVMMVGFVVLALVVYADWKIAQSSMWITASFVTVTLFGLAYILILRYWEKVKEIQDCPNSVSATPVPEEEKRKIQLDTAIIFSVLLFVSICVTIFVSMKTPSSSSVFPSFSFGHSTVEHVLPAALSYY